MKPPFDPNGMIMDVLRSCYTRKMRYVKGDISKTFDATWYFAAETALPFPGFHLFSSAVWDTVHPTAVTLGDSESFSRRWYNGRRLNRSDGRSFAGPKECFLQGAPAPGDLDRAFDGTPVVCLKPPFGEMHGGEVDRVFPDQAAVIKAGTDNPASSEYAGIKKGGSTS